MKKTAPAFGTATLPVLFAVNLLPILGVIFWKWSVFEIVVLYWCENIVIGAVNLLKMAIAKDGRADFKKNSSQSFYDRRRRADSNSISNTSKTTLLPFFTFHYGMFCFVHGAFVFRLLGKGKYGVELASYLANGGIWFLIGIIFSHLYAFVTEYVVTGEYRRTTTQDLFMAPYGRVIVLHIAIIFGALLIQLLGSPIFLLLLLIIGKILLDASLHLMSRGKQWRQVYKWLVKSSKSFDS